MGGVTFDTIVNKALQLGGGKFEQGTISLAEGDTVKAGTILRRATDKKFEPASPDDTALIAVVPFDITYSGQDRADMGFRALIGGQVRRDMLNISGEAITDAHADALRDYGIIAVASNDVSRVNPDTSA
jgi:hypothetical protein